MTVKQIIAEWLRNKIDTNIQYHHLEQCKEYGKLFHSLIHNQGTYDRAFRALKERPKELEEYGIKLVKIPTKSVADEWTIVKI